MLRRDERVQQRHDVLHFTAVNQGGFFADLRGNIQCAQFVLQRQQTSAFARQHHDVGGLEGCRRELRGNPRGGLAGFQRAQRFFRDFAGLRQAVAPIDGLRTLRLSSLDSHDRRQAPDRAQLRSICAVRAKAFVAVHRRSLRHGRIDSADDALRVAPGVVTAQQVAAQTALHKGLRRPKHLRLSTPETVNALLRVTHDKDAGRLPGASIAAQPSQQRLPLQGIGVLKFIDQQMTHTGIEFFLHPARQHGVS